MSLGAATRDPMSEERRPDQLAAQGDAETRMRRIVEEHYAFLWRTLRRLGVDAPQVEDAAQAVLTVTARRLADIRAGAERSFLIGVAMRVASDVRRAAPWRVAVKT